MTDKKRIHCTHSPVVSEAQPKIRIVSPRSMPRPRPTHAIEGATHGEKARCRRTAWRDALPCEANPDADRCDSSQTRAGSRGPPTRTRHIEKESTMVKEERYTSANHKGGPPTHRLTFTHATWAGGARTASTCADSHGLSLRRYGRPSELRPSSVGSLFSCHAIHPCPVCACGIDIALQAGSRQQCCRGRRGRVPPSSRCLAARRRHPCCQQRIRGYRVRFPTLSRRHPRSAPLFGTRLLRAGKRTLVGPSTRPNASPRRARHG